MLSPDGSSGIVLEDINNSLADAFGISIQFDQADICINSVGEMGNLLKE